MVPRCFLYSSPAPPSSRRRNGKDLRSGTLPLTQLREGEKEEGVVKSTPLSVSTNGSSRPIVIPTRSRSKALRQHHGPSAVTQCNSNPLETSPYKHDPEALPPALGTLLAVTSIPHPSQRSSVERHRKCRRRHQKQTPAQGLQVGELRAGNSGFATGFTSSSLEILLGAPDELGEAHAAPRSALMCTSEQTARSHSSDSIPSLENDNESTASSSTPSTPGPSSRRVSVEKRQRALSSPRAQECALDHPLLSSISEPDRWWSEFTDRTATLKALVTTPPVPPKSLLKSNLTAGLRVLKSAARSFSNFTAPVVQHDENLTRSMLVIQPHATDDRRPLPSGEPPDPVLRRYLNPVGASPAELHMHSCYFNSRHRSDLPCKFSVQLQTYRRSTAVPKKATSPPVFLSRYVAGPEAGQEAAQANTAPEIRQREPRENGDFLRVIVMEMNMRREGKLAENAKGKARLWLPPRAPCQRQSRHDGDVRKRWISQVPGN